MAWTNWIPHRGLEVICIDPQIYPDLTKGKEYKILYTSGDVWIFVEQDDSGSYAGYRKSCFVPKTKSVETLYTTKE